MDSRYLAKQCVIVALVITASMDGNVHFVKPYPVSIADVSESVNECAGSLSAKTSTVDIRFDGWMRGKAVENHPIGKIKENLKKTKPAFRKIAKLNSEDPRSFSKQVELLNCSTQIFIQLLAGSTSSVPKSLSILFLQWHSVYIHFLQKILGGVINEPHFFLGYYWDPFFWPRINHNIRTIDQLLQISDSNNSAKSMFDADAVIDKMRRMSKAGPVYRAGIDVQGNLTGMLFNTTLSLLQEPGPVDPNRFLHHGMVDRIWTHLLQNGSHNIDPQVRNMTFVLFDETGTKVNVRLA